MRVGEGPPGERSAPDGVTNQLPRGPAAPSRSGPSEMAAAVPGTYGSVLRGVTNGGNVTPGGVRLRPSVGRLGLSSPDGNAVALHPRIERAAGDPEQRGGLGLVALGALERLLDQALFDLIQAQPQR